MATTRCFLTPSDFRRVDSCARPWFCRRATVPRLLDELQRDYRSRVAVDALVYAVLHFIKPPAEILRTLPGFPGLLLLGLTFGEALPGAVSVTSIGSMPVWSGATTLSTWGSWWNILVKFLTGYWR